MSIFTTLCVFALLGSIACSDRYKNHGSVTLNKNALVRLVRFGPYGLFSRTKFTVIKPSKSPIPLTARRIRVSEVWVRFVGIRFYEKSGDEDNLCNWAAAEFGSKVSVLRYSRDSYHFCVDILLSVDSMRPKSIGKSFEEKCLQLKTCQDYVVGTESISYKDPNYNDGLCSRALICCGKRYVPGPNGKGRAYCNNYCFPYKCRKASTKAGSWLYSSTATPSSSPTSSISPTPSSTRYSKMDLGSILGPPAPSPTASPSISPDTRRMIRMEFLNVPVGSSDFNWQSLFDWYQHQTATRPPRQYFHGVYRNGNLIMYYAPPRMFSLHATALVMATNNTLYLNRYRCISSNIPWDYSKWERPSSHVLLVLYLY